MDTNSLTLEHYGVKGMRWGVRKERSTDAGSSIKERMAARDKKIKGDRAKVLSSINRYSEARADFESSYTSKKGKTAAYELMKKHHDIAAKNISSASKLTGKEWALYLTLGPVAVPEPFSVRSREARKVVKGKGLAKSDRKKYDRYGNLKQK